MTKRLDQEFFDQLSTFVDDLITSIPTSDDAAIDALEAKAKELRHSKDRSR